MTAIKPILPLDGYRITPLIHIAIHIDRLKIPNNFFFREFCCFASFFPFGFVFLACTSLVSRMCLT